MEEKIKYVALADEDDDDVCSPDYYGFKESEFDNGYEIIENAVYIWEYNYFMDIDDILCKGCETFKFYNLKKELIGTFSSDASFEEIEKQLNINLTDFIGFFDEDYDSNGKTVCSVVLLNDGSYDGYEGLLNLIDQMLEANNISKYSLDIETIYY